MFFFLINESFDCFLQQMKIGHPVDPDVPEGPDLALAPHHTHDENDPDPSTGKLHTSLNMLSMLTHESLAVGCSQLSI